jgi:hypothetical protein
MHADTFATQSANMKYALIFLMLACAPTLDADAGSVSGKIRSQEDKAALAEVNVLILRSADSGLVKTGVTDKDGRYFIEAPAPGTFIVKAMLIGYEPAFSSPFAGGEADVTVPDILLIPARKALKEVTVRSQKPLIEVHADKVVMNVEASITNTGSTALEVLQRAPGVTVDQNDNISLKGRQGVNIMMDGKLLPISGSDLANVLKGMPSASIEKIEIISNPGAKYDAAGTAGIINIRTKRDKRMGANGSVTAGYGQGVYPKANAGFNLNYRNKKLAMYSSYNYSYRKGINNLGLMRRFYSNGQFLSAYDQRNDMLLELRNHYGTIGADYSLSARTTIGAVLTGGINGFDLVGDSRAVVLDAVEAPASNYNTIRNNSNEWNNAGINLNIRHQFDSAGSEITIDLDYARYANSSDQTLNTAYRLMDGTQQAPDYLLYGTMAGYTDIRALKADYTKSVGKTLRLEAGIKSSLVRADNNPVFYDRSGGGNVYDSGKSNHFIYDENINAAYLNAAKDWTLWSLQAGLRAEQTIAKGHQLVNDDRFDRNYAQLFPSLALTRHLNQKNDLGITVSRRIDRPNYQQLNPFRRYLDVTSVNQGNPYLLPSFIWTTELSHTWKGRFITQLSWSRTTDVITQVIQPEAGQITIVTDKNLATNTLYSLSGSYPLQPAKWWSSVNSFNLYYTHYEGNLANTPLNDGTPAFQVSTQNSFTLLKDWSAELTGWYQSAQRYGYMHINPQYAVNFGVQKMFLEKKATLKLSVTDIFLKQNPTGESDFSAYHEDFTVLRDSRVATLTATYRFGKRTVAPTRKRARGAEDELRRAGAGNGAG